MPHFVKNEDMITVLTLSTKALKRAINAMDRNTDIERVHDMLSGVSLRYGSVVAIEDAYSSGDTNEFRAALQRAFDADDAALKRKRADALWKDLTNIGQW